MTESERQQLICLVAEMRAVASRVGSMHSFWDDIFDIEGFLAGRETIVSKTSAEYIALATGRLNEAKQQ